MDVPDANRKNSILIADDDNIMVKALAHILMPYYTIYIAKNGQEAIETARAMLPDVILLDILMPEKNGFEVITELKTHAETRDTPMIFVTGLDSNENEEHGFILGAADYINKPFTPSVVRLRVENQIKIVNQMRLIRHMSTTDELTGMANRRHFNSEMQSMWRNAFRTREPLGLLLLDIDHFKLYNDRFGHLDGDQVLVDVASIVKGQLKRPMDLLARWGGEEFAVLLPDTSIEGAGKLAEDIRLAIKTHFLDKSSEPNKAVTVSIGVCSIIPEKSCTIDRFVSDADMALYAAKNAGRDRVELCPHHCDEGQR